MKSNCTICGTKKTRFLKEQESKSLFRKFFKNQQRIFKDDIFMTLVLLSHLI